MYLFNFFTWSLFRNGMLSCFSCVAGLRTVPLNMFCGPEKGRFFRRFWSTGGAGLAAKAVQSTSLSFQCVDHVHCRHCLPLRVLRICYGVPYDVFKEYLEDASCLLVDETGYALHSA